MQAAKPAIGIKLRVNLDLESRGSQWSAILSSLRTRKFANPDHLFRFHHFSGIKPRRWLCGSRRR